MLSELLLTTDARFLLVSATIIYFAAGVVKGTFGIGFPTMAVSLLAQVTDARTAITVVIMPMLITNLWQVLRSSGVLRLARRFSPLIILMLLFIMIFSQIASRIPVSVLTAILGVIVVFYAAHSLYARPVALPQAWDRPAQCLAGMIAGTMGGLGSVWAPPMLIYRRAIRLEKEQFVAAAGLFLLAGSIVLLLGYVTTGALSSSLWLLSSLLVVPAIAGFSVGESIRKRLSNSRFERLLTWFFLIMGVNLIRRALIE